MPQPSVLPLAVLMAAHQSFLFLLEMLSLLQINALPPELNMNSERLHILKSIPIAPSPQSPIYMISGGYHWGGIKVNG